jgi:small subunit ribosomal protein S15
MLKKKEYIASLKAIKQGSTESQITNLTNKIKIISNHLVINKKDYSSQRGLLKNLGKRKRLLYYLANNDIKLYKKLINQLGIRNLKNL